MQDLYDMIKMFDLWRKQPYLITFILAIFDVF